MLNPFIIHTGLDVLAVTLALLGGWLVYRWRFQDSLPKTANSIGHGRPYLLVELVVAAVLILIQHDTWKQCATMWMIMTYRMTNLMDDRRIGLASGAQISK